MMPCPSCKAVTVPGAKAEAIGLKRVRSRRLLPGERHYKCGDCHQLWRCDEPDVDKLVAVRGTIAVAASADLRLDGRISAIGGPRRYSDPMPRLILPEPLALVASSTLESGAYLTDRAAALSGVPRSTVHYWARHSILAPSISAEKPLMWSYVDLVRLRIIYWLRQPKTLAESLTIPPSKMSTIRSALDQLRTLDLGMLDEAGNPRLVVDASGNVAVRDDSGALSDAKKGQLLMPCVDVIAPFDTSVGTRGPDLRAPRPSLRIVPGKLAGEPHVANTRLETLAIAALSGRGFTVSQVCDFYPFAGKDAVEQAIDLEEQLNSNIAA